MRQFGRAVCWICLVVNVLAVVGHLYVLLYTHDPPRVPEHLFLLALAVVLVGAFLWLLEHDH